MMFIRSLIIRAHCEDALPDGFIVPEAELCNAATHVGEVAAPAAYGSHPQLQWEVPMRSRNGNRNHDALQAPGGLHAG